MINVTPKPEPADFARLVGAPGHAFILRNRPKRSSDFNGHSYWKRVMPDMLQRYESRCAYSAMPVLGDASIDHFNPKTAYPAQAYVWSNYRLCLSKLNGKKGDDVTVLDPFTIQSGWFQLDLASLFVVPNPEAPAVILPRVRRTISKLDLNSNALVTARFNVYSGYLGGGIELDYLQSTYPFIAAEIVRQAY